MRNGRGSGRVSPSTVTWRSAIASRSADCVFGSARLTSSARSTFANTGPGRNSNSRVRWSYSDIPVTSDGWRSGVHWMRAAAAPVTLCASARASTVLAVPGTSSIRTCPSQAAAATTSSICRRLPRTTVSTLSIQRRATLLAAAIASRAGSTSARASERGIVVMRAVGYPHETGGNLRGWRCVSAVARDDARAGRLERRVGVLSGGELEPRERLRRDLCCDRPDREADAVPERGHAADRRADDVQCGVVRQNRRDGDVPRVDGEDDVALGRVGGADDGAVLQPDARGAVAGRFGATV